MLTLELAEHRFTIRDHFPYMRQLCRDYLVDSTDGQPLDITKAELLAERSAEGTEDPGYLESLAYYRKIAEILIEEDILLFHASALALDGEAVLFTAPSGTGKSTHASLWRQHFGKRIQTINDDKPLLRVTESGVTVYGTPYSGKEDLQTNTKAPVRAVVLLRQAPENTMRRLSPKEAFPILLSQTHRSDKETSILKTLELVSILSQQPVYELGCTISEEAVTLCANTVFGQTEEKP